MSDNYDGPAMAQEIIKLRAQLADMKRTAECAEEMRDASDARLADMQKDHAEVQKQRDHYYAKWRESEAGYQDALGEHSMAQAKLGRAHGLLREVETGFARGYTDDGMDLWRRISDALRSERTTDTSSIVKLVKSLRERNPQDEEDYGYNHAIDDVLAAFKEESEKDSALILGNVIKNPNMPGLGWKGAPPEVLAELPNEDDEAETDSNRYEDAAKFLDASEKEKAEMIKKLAKELSGEEKTNGG